jgi:DNA-binding transcriptional MerR regulator
MTRYTIQQVAESTGLSIHALRYYEKIGLLPTIERASNNHRQYCAEDVAWLEFLIRLRETGMSIQEMLAFTNLVRQRPNEVGERRVLLEEHRDRVTQHLEELTQNLKIIEMKIEHYQYLEATGENDQSCIFWKQYLDKQLEKSRESKQF